MSLLLSILFSVLTTLSDGMFHTQYETEVEAGAEVCNVVVDSMIYYLQTDPAKLSKQFFGGLGKQEDTQKNAFYPCLVAQLLQGAFGQGVLDDQPHAEGTAAGRACAQTRLERIVAVMLPKFGQIV